MKLFKYTLVVLLIALVTIVLVRHRDRTEHASVERDSALEVGKAKQAVRNQIIAFGENLRTSHFFHQLQQQISIENMVHLSVAVSAQADEQSRDCAGKGNIKSMA